MKDYLNSYQPSEPGVSAAGVKPAAAEIRSAEIRPTEVEVAATGIGPTEPAEVKSATTGVITAAGV